MLSRTPSRKLATETAPEDASLVAASRAYDHQKFELAERTWRVLAERGDAEAQFRLAESYLSGPRAEELSAEATRWFTRAAEQDHPLAQNELGLIYRFGQGVQADPVEAARWTERAALQGVAEAQVNLGTVYARGEGVAQDSDKAREWYARGATTEHLFTPVTDSNSRASSRSIPRELGTDRPRDGAATRTGPEREAAAPESNLAAKLSDTERLREAAGAVRAQGGAANLTPNNDQLSKILIRQDGKTRHQNSGEPAPLNGGRQPSGRSERIELPDPFRSERDEAGSRPSSGFETSAPNENRETALRTESDPGTLEGLTGDGGTSSPRGPVSRYLAGEVAYRERRFGASLAIWEPLASKGVALAQLALGNLYESGRGSAQDLGLAAYWYEKAAAQGLPEAHYALGLCYLFGRGVPEDRAAALVRLQRAANLGSGYAKSVFPELERELETVERSPSTEQHSGTAMADQARQSMPHAPTYSPEITSKRGSGTIGRQERRSSHRRRRGSRRRAYWRIALAAIAILFVLGAGAYVAGPGTLFN